MHPRSIYRDQPPDFEELAEACPSLKKHLVARVGARDGDRGRGSTIDFRREEAVEELTKCLLRRNFGVAWERPPGSLIPPVPNRLNYILWLKDLLASTATAASQGGERKKNNNVVGIDIGTGGSLIYALIGAAECGWEFLATDVTCFSLEWAERNRSLNPHLSHLIHIRDARTSETSQGGDPAIGIGNILLGVLEEGCVYDFCMCNPPFFDTGEARKLHKPGHGGLSNELNCPGGEEAFVGRMVADSNELRDKVAWYTSMIGRKKTLKRIKAQLDGMQGIKSVRTTTFVQGRTTRWGIAWSFVHSGNPTHLRSPSSPTQPLPSRPGRTIVQALGLLRDRGRLSRSHTFTLQMSGRARPCDAAVKAKEAFTASFREKLLWDDDDKSSGFVIQLKENGFELTCSLTVAGCRKDGDGAGDESPPSKRSKATIQGADKANAECAMGSISYSGATVTFKTCIFQYSQGCVSFQSTLCNKGAEERELMLFQAIMSCLEASL